MTVDGQSVMEPLARTVAALSVGDLSNQARTDIERCFLDTVGVTLAGTREEGALVTRSLAPYAGGGPASVVGSDRTLSVPEAALVNATAGHALDYDDVCRPLQNHPSVPLVAPILALGEATDADGADLVAAFAAGFEAQAYVGSAVLPEHYERGWHATATLGTFGAAAACANILSMEVADVAKTLGLAASFPSGLKRNFGTTAKPLHAGAAARSGVTSALVVAEGGTANVDVLDGPKGFADAYADGWNTTSEHEADSLAVERYHVQPKRFPCCNWTHSGIAAALRIRDERGVSPDDVVRVHVVESPTAFDTLVDHPPRTPLEAKFSMEYAVATALRSGDVTLADFTDEALETAGTARLRERVTVESDHALEAGSHTVTVAVETDDGTTVEETVDDPPGTAENPMTDEALREKFRACAGLALDEPAVSRALAALESLGDQDHASAVVEPLTSGE